MEYTLHIRDEAPEEEIRSALVNFGKSFPYSGGWDANGEAHLWSDTAWYCGYVTQKEEEK